MIQNKDSDRQGQEHMEKGKKSKCSVNRKKTVLRWQEEIQMNNGDQGRCKRNGHRI